MGHRALVAYERSDGSYNLHYSHWGACNLRLRNRITSETPYGGTCPAKWARETYQALTAGEPVEAVRERYIDGSGSTDVEPVPQTTDVSLEEIITAHLDYLMHEAFFVVDRAFEVTTYRTLWFGLQYEAECAASRSAVGDGAVRKIRWHDNRPVGDGYAQGQFAGMKRIVGEFIDRGMIDEATARRLLKQQLVATVDSENDVRFGAIA
jgi:hypothetical protein